MWKVLSTSYPVISGNLPLLSSSSRSLSPFRHSSTIFSPSASHLVTSSRTLWLMVAATLYLHSQSVNNEPTVRNGAYLVRLSGLRTELSSRARQSCFVLEHWSLNCGVNRMARVRTVSRPDLRADGLTDCSCGLRHGYRCKFSM